MATFRSRQRSNQRRDVKREPRSPRPEEGKAPVDPAAASNTARPKTARPSGPPSDRKPSAPRKPDPRRDVKPHEGRARSDERKSPAAPGAAPKPAFARPTGARPSGARPDTRTPRQDDKRPARESRVDTRPTPAPAKPDTPAAQATPPAPATRRRLITPASEAPPPSRTLTPPAEPAVETPRPTPLAVVPAPDEPKPTRRRLIIPASEAREPSAEHAAPTPAAKPEPSPAPNPVPAVAPVDAPRATRRRLITPASEAPPPKTENETPVTPAAEEDEAPPRPARKARPIAPSVHAPDPRRGLPTNERMPTERPVFERRSAETRRRGDAPVALAMFASCPRGLEPVLNQELQRMQAADIEPVDGGVGFNGSIELLMRVNLESRVASRVLLRLAQGPYENERDVNALAMQIDWPSYFDVSRTIKVKTDGVGAQVKSLDFVSLTVKDAICDRFRQAQLGRPNVDTREPDARIQVFLSPREATIYLDSSGEPLFKRGWRKETGEAPLRENLAAGILLLAGYNGEQALIDPMCGSGTFLVEAAEIALNRAPGRSREFAFQKWLTFDPAAWEEIKGAARLAEKPLDSLPIQGSDNDAKMVSISRANLERADLSHLIKVQKQDMFEVRPNAPTGLIVTNPPYGVRMDEQASLAELYPQIGDWLKQHFTGWTANLFSGDMNLAKLIHLSVKRRIPLYNGSLHCRVFVLRLIAGSAREEKP